MVKISKVLTVADNVCDCIPVVSVFNNLVDLVAKGIFKVTNEENGQRNRWTRHVTNKPVSKCLLYMIPFYGLVTKVFCRPRVEYVRYIDYSEDQEIFKELDFLLNVNQSFSNWLSLLNEPDFRVDFPGPCIKGLKKGLSETTSDSVPYIAFKVRNSENQFYAVKLVYAPSLKCWTEVTPTNDIEPRFFIKNLGVDRQFTHYGKFQELLRNGEATDISGKKWFFDSQEFHNLTSP